MELDDLKLSWKQADKNVKKQNNNIMELIQHKSYGPVAALKKAFIKQIIFMSIIPFVLVATNADDLYKVFTSIMFWSYVAFCIGVILLSWYNYRTTHRMEGMDAMVRSNLEKQVSILEARLKWNIVVARIALIFFIILAEVLPYFQHYRMLDKWHSLSPFIRYGTYALLLTMQYFFSHALVKRKFGRHLTYLKELVKEMQ